ncbi:hypothetical protein RND71_043565 [Anisodus tanguticus]|uniref:Isopropylmalate dehydrogenase-like domain-containing protein n=1 Tax=Anisodus tanguticus TaxID=243964 RepID=A0AAE1QP00_9SOLA|nr:hypothetical protein RND71_043565 [Anisodus tanguticus]
MASICRFKQLANLLNVSSKNINIPLSAKSLSTQSLEFPSQVDGKVKCTLIPGDGVGPELCASVKEVIQAMAAPVEFDELFLSEINPSNSVPFDNVIESIKKNRIALKGILSTPTSGASTGELQSLNMKIRKKLDLFANVVHVKSMQGVNSRHSNINFIIIREQTEGEYSALEHQSVPGVIECMKIITESNSRRIAKFAFNYATKLGRKKVTAVHKANIMKMSDGLFLKCCQEVAESFPHIEFDSMIIDNTCMQMVSNPQQFDVMVMPNLYGNIIDNLATGLVGGAGVVPGANYSNHCVIYEPVSSFEVISFGQAVGKNIANPTAMLLCAARMLKHVNLHYYSKKLQESVEGVIAHGKTKTRDLGGYSSTTDFTRAVISNLQ